MGDRGLGAVTFIWPTPLLIPNGRMAMQFIARNDCPGGDHIHVSPLIIVDAATLDSLIDYAEHNEDTLVSIERHPLNRKSRITFSNGMWETHVNVPQMKPAVAIAFIEA